MACIRVNICDMTYDGTAETNPLYITALYISAPFLHPTPSWRLTAATSTHRQPSNRLVRSRRDLFRDASNRELADISSLCYTVLLLAAYESCC